MKVGRVGCGSMGKMLLWKFSESGLYGKDSLLVANRTVDKLEEVRDIATICSNTEAASEADIIFVCVRPSDMKAVLAEIEPSINKDALLVTLNGSITFEMIQKVINHRTAKVIPSVTADINKTHTIVCYNELVNQSDNDNVTSLIEILGKVIE